MRNFSLWLLATLFVGSLAFGKPGAHLEPDADDWKGKPYPHHLQFSVLGGLGVFGNSAGFGANGAVAYKIMHQGFVPDINDQAHIELMLGPVFMSAGTAFSYSLHLRWDFHRNELWSFYAIGGLGGGFAGATLANASSFYPRVGVGGFWNLFEFLSFRFEVSHEFTGVGVTYLL